MTDTIPNVQLTHLSQPSTMLSPWVQEWLQHGAAALLRYRPIGVTLPSLSQQVQHASRWENLPLRTNTVGVAQTDHFVQRAQSYETLVRTDRFMVHPMNLKIAQERNLWLPSELAENEVAAEPMTPEWVEAMTTSEGDMPSPFERMVSRVKKSEARQFSPRPTQPQTASPPSRQRVRPGHWSFDPSHWSLVPSHSSVVSSQESIDEEQRTPDKGQMTNDNEQLTIDDITVMPETVSNSLFQRMLRKVAPVAEPTTSPSMATPKPDMPSESVETRANKAIKPESESVNIEPDLTPLLPPTTAAPRRIRPALPSEMTLPTPKASSEPMPASPAPSDSAVSVSQRPSLFQKMLGKIGRADDQPAPSPFADLPSMADSAEGDDQPTPLVQAKIDESAAHVQTPKVSKNLEVLAEEEEEWADEPPARPIPPPQPSAATEPSSTETSPTVTRPSRPPLPGKVESTVTMIDPATYKFPFSQPEPSVTESKAIPAVPTVAESAVSLPDLSLQRAEASPEISPSESDSIEVASSIEPTVIDTLPLVTLIEPTAQAELAEEVHAISPTKPIKSETEVVQKATMESKSLDLTTKSKDFDSISTAVTESVMLPSETADLIEPIQRTELKDESLMESKSLDLITKPKGLDSVSEFQSDVMDTPTITLEAESVKSKDLDSVGTAELNITGEQPVALQRLAVERDEVMAISVESVMREAMQPVAASVESQVTPALDEATQSETALSMVAERVPTHEPMITMESKPLDLTAKSKDLDSVDKEPTQLQKVSLETTSKPVVARSMVGEESQPGEPLERNSTRVGTENFQPLHDMLSLDETDKSKDLDSMPVVGKAEGLHSMPVIETVKPKGLDSVPVVSKSKDLDSISERPRPKAELPIVKTIPQLSQASATEQLLAQGWRFKQTPLSSPLNQGGKRGVEAIARAIDDLTQRPDPGRPLAAEPRQALEGILGQDFSQVRLHEASLSGLNVQAAARGRDVYVEAGQARFDTPDSMALLGHELTHVAQQGFAKPLVQRQVDNDEARPHMFSKPIRSDVARDEAEAEQSERQVKSFFTAMPMAKRVDGRRETVDSREESVGEQDRVGSKGNKTATPPQFNMPLVTPTVMSALAIQRAVAVDEVSSNVEVEQPAASHDAPSPAMDLGQLAQQIYPLIKRRLRIEREMVGGR